MNTIGIIGAMDVEISLIKDKMEIITTKNIIGLDFHLGKMLGKNIILVKCGIGKVNASICTQILIDLYGADYIINLGVAGAISKELEIGDVVIGASLVHHDFNCVEFGHSIGVIPGLEESTFKSDERLVKIAEECSENSLGKSGIFIGKIASGDQFISKSETKQKIWDTLKPMCAEMEGAAIGQTCYLNKIPFIVIRAISDKADDSADVNFNEFVEMASKRSSEIVEKMVGMI